MEIQEHAGDAVPGLVVFQQPEIGLYQRLVESVRNCLAELELEYGIEKSNVDSIRAKLRSLFIRFSLPLTAARPVSGGHRRAATGAGRG